MGDCGVCIGSDDYGESASFSNMEYPKARKVHTCEECYRDIAIGQTYEKYSGVWDGSFSNHKTCMDCVNIRRGMSCNNSVCFGQLWEEIYYIFPEVTTGCLERIKTPSAKAYFIERWNQWKFKKKPATI
jgi:hypothetical protein